MKNKKLAAFTLVEALIGVIIMMIVIGGIALSIKMGIDMYGRAEAHSELINGMRFTLDSFNREISPMLDVTREVEILSTDISNIPSVSDDNHYIYLENGSLTHRSSSGDEILTGSEYIDRVAFSYPTDTKETGENYTLRMDLTAKHERYGNTEYNTTLEKAMYNLPSKRGDNGNILRFKYSDAVDVNVINIKHYRKNNNTPENNVIDVSNLIDISNSTDIKGITIIVSYDLTIDGTVNEPYEDVSLVEYFISSSQEASLDISNEEPSDEEDSSGFKGKHYWQLLDKSEIEIQTGLEIGTSGDLKTTYGSGGKYQWSFGTIRSRVTPRIADLSGNILAEGAPVWGPYTTIIDRRDDGTPLLHDNWSEAIRHAIMNGWEQTKGFITGISDVSYTIDTDTGHNIIRFNANGNNNSTVFAEADLKYMKRERNLQREKCGAAYTNITNYSLIVDAQIKETSGYGILINGRILNPPDDGKNIQDNGYVFQYDRARTTFPVRIFGNGRQGGGSGINDYYFGAQPEFNNFLSGYDSLNSASEYVPRSLQNNAFRMHETRSDFFNKRQRVLYTILEYYYPYIENPDKIGEYINDPDAKKKPHYIVRMRTLKTGEEVDEILKKMSPEKQAQDPWHIGKEFYNSEPIWYGDFVGASPAISGDKYIFEVKNFSEKHNNTKIEFTRPVSGEIDLRRNRNVFRLDDAKSGKEASSVVRGYDLNIREHLYKKWPRTGTWDTNNYNKETLDKIYTSDGKRYIGIRIWNSKNEEAGVTIYEINMAPGFCDSELKALLPKGARIYETKEAYSNGDWDKLSEEDKNDKFSWKNGTDENLNGKVLEKSSFRLTGTLASDGEGNDKDTKEEDRNIGIMDIRHTWPLDKCKCPLCKLFK
ncbi:hypothetical protein [Cloacibacillus sp.]|uniref:hypothetical protein n=1 Tax=Cloacibacillus sp. TaxID=2049023 RepID=UPI0025C72F83|nr:hypothetical protein [Cloacibacillus sp.]MCC8058777.1 hypothetical protein [Cloacibacillus sp.]